MQKQLLDKIQHAPMVNTPIKLEIEGNVFDLIKVLYQKPTNDIILNGERSNVFH